MRNLKKTLCLVLALVFVLGLCTVGVSATDVEFTDSAQINDQYTNAIKAMNGLKILEGYPDGSFGPEKSVTRAEAAAIIARIVLGAENAKKWPARATFDDVGDDHWAVGYIAFCRSRGIIDGVGNNKFDPDRPVKQVELAKMLLAACGYGAKGEFVGEDWDYNVIERAMKAKIIKNLVPEDVDWTANATREITSIMSYTTMMTVPQVEVSKDTDAYVNLQATNGVDVGTYARATWGLNEVTGVVQNNKASLTDTKGTTIRYAGTGGLANILIETDEDEDAGLLGHQVKVQYRQEQRADGTNYWKAYFLEDLSGDEVGAMSVIGKDIATTTYNFYDGVVAAGLGAGLIGGNLPTVDNWFFFGGAYVLDKDGAVLSYKQTTYEVLPLEVSSLGKNVVKWTDYTVAPAVTADVEVKIPTGAKAGDMLTVYKCNQVYTAKACTKETEILITQNAYNSTYGYYTYNEGAIDLTEATNQGAIYMGSAMTPYDYTALNAPQLNLNSSYTLYFDAEGLCYAFSDELVNGVPAASAFFWVMMDITAANIAAGGGATVEMGKAVNQYQVVGSDGTIKTVSLTTDATYVLPGATINAENAATTKTLGMNTNHIYRSAYGAFTTADKLNYGSQLTYNGVYTNGTGNYGMIGSGYDFSGATFVSINGYGSGATASTKYKPAYGAKIWFTYEEKTVGTAIVKKVQTVWFDAADIAPAYNAESYIYVSSTAVAYTQLENGMGVKYYAGLQEGKKVNFALSTTSDPIQVGFAKYEEGSRYTLSFIPAATMADAGTATRVRNVYVVDQDTDYNVALTTVQPYKAYPNFILNGRLYLEGTNTVANSYGVDLSKVTFVKTGMLVYDSSLPDVSTAGNLMSALRAGWKIKLAFVEVVSPDGFTHTAGGNTIYVVGMSKNDIPGYE